MRGIGGLAHREDDGMLDLEAAVFGFIDSLSACATSARAEKEKRYLKSGLRFLGASVPDVRREARAFVRAHPDLTRDELEALARILWDSDTHELRSVGIALLELRGDLLRESDADWLLHLVKRCNTWAHVDWIATKVLGGMAAREPSVETVLDRWSRDANFWVRRSALLASHDRLAAGIGDFERFEWRAAALLEENEFFIRKAIGWVLRSTCKKTPERTIGFVQRHAREMSALTFREATRALDPSVRRRLESLKLGR